MKITKRELKNLIKEEVSDMSGIEELLKDLLSKLEKLDLEVHGRLQSSFSSGLANAAWEWVVKKKT